MFWSCSVLVSNQAETAKVITAAENSVNWLLEGVNIVYIYSRQAVQEYHMITWLIWWRQIYSVDYHIVFWHQGHFKCCKPLKIFCLWCHLTSDGGWRLSELLSVGGGGVHPGHVATHKRQRTMYTHLHTQSQFKVTNSPNACLKHTLKLNITYTKLTEIVWNWL